MIYNLVSTESEIYEEPTIHYTDDKVFFECDYKNYSLHAKDNNIMMPNNILEEINKFLLDNEKIIYYNVVLSNVGSDITDYNIMVSNYGNLIYLISTENYQYGNNFESVTMYLYKINDKLIQNQEKLIYKINKSRKKIHKKYYDIGGTELGVVRRLKLIRKIDYKFCEVINRFLAKEDIIYNLKQRINMLENHIKYMPNGEGYQEAKDHFDSLIK